MHSKFVVPPQLGTGGEVIYSPIRFHSICTYISMPCIHVYRTVRNTSSVLPAHSCRPVSPFPRDSVDHGADGRTNHAPTHACLRTRHTRLLVHPAINAAHAGCRRTHVRTRRTTLLGQALTHTHSAISVNDQTATTHTRTHAHTLTRARCCRTSGVDAVAVFVRKDRRVRAQSKGSLIPQV